MYPRTFLLLAALVAPLTSISAAEPAKAEAAADSDGPAAGHSYHGEAFNEGPRQAAVLIDGMSPIEFGTSSKSPAAQKFIEQGIAQLHGFWYLEAERSFRQAAKEDPQLAMAYWGMAMANANNTKRAREFMDKAMELSKKDTRHRETLYIEALDRLIPKEKKDEKKDEKKVDREAERDEKKKRTERYLSDMERLLHEFPEDIEARVLLALQLWLAERSGVKITSRYAVNALLGEVFAANPMHPAHHYRIHLWDSARPDNALHSAAQCGPASPGIAHMWHMPGHIYSKLKRYEDAAWQQEASARVDHAHMIRTRLMPDQTHNFAHNNEWLVRNLIYVGRVQDALDLSRNLVSLPQHPKYNSWNKRGSYKYGRQRLVQTLTEYALWEELIKESGGNYLIPTTDDAQQEEWLGWLAVAQFMTGDSKQGARTLRSLQRRSLVLQTKVLDLEDKQADVDDAKSSKNEKEADKETAEPEKPEPTLDEVKRHISQLDQSLAKVRTADAVKRKDLKSFKENLPKARLNPLIQAQWQGEIGDLDEGIKIAEKAVRDGSGQVRPLAVLVDLLWKKDRKDDAKTHFAKLQKTAGTADLNTPMLAKLAPVAKAAGAKTDWRLPEPPNKDLGERPPLNDLGPFRWQPYQSPTWGAKAPDGKLVAGEEFDGRPRIIIFYLGFGCLHCIEQIHAFSPLYDEYKKAGIDVIAISTETVDDLQKGMEDFGEEINIPLLSNGDQHVFKAFRCWDDFENQPLHGTFLIDHRGKVRWQDISYEPFNDAKFLLEESKRLLALP
jgi:peroxiredoxin